MTAGLVDATDVEGLKTLDVILLGINFAMAPGAAAALHEAVRSGVGLLNEWWTGRRGPTLAVRLPRRNETHRRLVPYTERGAPLLQAESNYELACVVSGFMEVVFDLVNPDRPSSDAGGTPEAG